MAPEDRKRCVDELFQAALNPTDEQLEDQKKEFDGKIKYFESKYGISSERLLELVKSNQLEESNDICSWLMLLKVRSRFVKHQGKT